MSETLSSGGSQSSSSPVSSSTKSESEGEEPAEKRLQESPIDFSLKAATRKGSIATSVITPAPPALHPLSLSLDHLHLPFPPPPPFDFQQHHGLLAAALANPFLGKLLPHAAFFPPPQPRFKVASPPPSPPSPPSDEADPVGAYQRFLLSAHAIAASDAEVPPTPPQAAQVSSTSHPHTEWGADAQRSVITSLPRARRPDVRAAVAAVAAAPPRPTSSGSCLDDRSRSVARSLPDAAKDDAYWERRRKNNEAAKRSRDSRRLKEEEVAMRATLLEQENMRLRMEVAQLKQETQQIRTILFNA